MHYLNNIIRFSMIKTDSIPAQGISKIKGLSDRQRILLYNGNMQRRNRGATLTAARNKFERAPAHTRPKYIKGLISSRFEIAGNSAVRFSLSVASLGVLLGNKILLAALRAGSNDPYIESTCREH